MSTKITVAILYGGKSAEHEVSISSARNVIAALDTNKYEVVLIGISKEGKWLLQESAQRLLDSVQGTEVIIAPESGGSLQHFNGNADQKIDVVFPILHGPLGEDGSIQGLLKLANVPFVGPSVLGSGVGMDKDVMKRLCREAGISVAPGIIARKGDIIDMIKLETDFGYPLFIKPANMGSSVGVHKAENRDELATAITDAFLYDTKILIETAINGQEVETAILGNENPQASLPGIVRPKGHSFYTYESKYEDDAGYELEIPAKLPREILKQVQEIALQVFQVCECEGLARVDSFVTGAGDIIVNEINTMPGFTNISMYPKLWEASGVGYSELIDRLIQLAIERHKRDSSLKTTK